MSKPAFRLASERPWDDVQTASLLVLEIKGVKPGVRWTASLGTAPTPALLEASAILVSCCLLLVHVPSVCLPFST